MGYLNKNDQGGQPSSTNRRREANSKTELREAQKLVEVLVATFAATIAANTTVLSVCLPRRTRSFVLVSFLYVD